MAPGLGRLRALGALSVALLALWGAEPGARAQDGASSALAFLTSLAGGDSAPKLSAAPLVHFDAGAKYYKALVEGMAVNFKRAVNKAGEKRYSLQNITTVRPLALSADGLEISEPASASGPRQLAHLAARELDIDGLNHVKVSSVHVDKEKLKLNVIFHYKLIRLRGHYYGPQSAKLKRRQAPQADQRPTLLEAAGWNVTWSASVMAMIGRPHIDPNKLQTSHAPHKLALKLAGEELSQLPVALQERLRTALASRVRAAIDARLLDVMESVLIEQPEVGGEPAESASKASVRQARPKRAASTKGAPSARLPPKRSKGTKGAKSKSKTSGAAKSTGKLEQKQPKQWSAVKSGVKASGPEGRPSSLPRSSRSSKSSSAANNKKSPAKRVLKRVKRQTPCQQGEELDDYVDQLFRFGTRIVRAMEPVALPNATIELPDYNLKIFLYEGKGTRAYKFKRAKPAWVFCSNETISLGVTIEVEELRVAYKYRVISGHRLLFDGDLEAKLSPKVQAQFSQAVQEEDSEEPVQQRIDRVRVFRLGRVHVVIRGLGNLTQSLSMIINSYLNDNQDELQPTFRMVEGDAVGLLNRALANVNVPLLSVV